MSITRRQTRASLLGLHRPTNAKAAVKVEKLKVQHATKEEDIEEVPTNIARKTRNSSVFRQAREEITNQRATVVKVETESVTRSVVSRVRQKPARRIKPSKTVGPPSNWQTIYDAVLEMRKDRSAPVDTMGCESLAAPHATARDRRFQTLIALMLSSQTKDTTNAVAIRNLQTQLPWPGLTLESILAVEPAKLNELIWVVGFHNTKTRHIKAAAILLRDNFNSDIPDSLEGLMSLPGVGPKMAYLCLAAAWGRIEGIGVDVHVHRITNLWKWHKTTTPEETRACLESWLPRDKWHEINHLLVGFGQTICTPVARKCGDCLLPRAGLCPSAVVPSKGLKRALSTSSDSA